MTDGLWMCPCGTENKDGMNACVVCGRERGAKDESAKIPEAPVAEKKAKKAKKVKPAPVEGQAVVETPKPKKEKKPNIAEAMGLKPTENGTYIIHCIEPGCTETREVKAQDVFQVKRCFKHQRSYRNKLRAASRKRRQARIREAMKPKEEAGTGTPTPQA